jgi:hypothetical protein
MFPLIIVLNCITGFFLTVAVVFVCLTVKEIKKGRDMWRDIRGR